MRDGRHARGGMSTLEFEDVVTVDLPDDGYVDRDFLREVFRDPQTYLPPRRRRMRDLEDRPRKTESLLIRRAKLTGLLTAVTALIGAVVAAAVLAERPTRGSSTENRRQHSVTGVDALGAFTITDAGKLSGASRLPSTGASTSHTESSRPRATPERPGAHAAGQAAPRDPGSATTSEPPTRGDRGGSAPTSSSGTSESTAPDARSAAEQSRTARSESASTASKLETVRRFYNLVRSSPDQALGMLAPGLLGNALHELRAVWQSLDGVRVLDVQERTDGSVLAVVAMHHPDGSLVRMTQLFDFSPGGIIDHVQLLSAQHS